MRGYQLLTKGHAVRSEWVGRFVPNLVNYNTKSATLWAGCLSPLLTMRSSHQYGNDCTTWRPIVPLLPAVDLHHRPHTPLSSLLIPHVSYSPSLFLYSWLFPTGGSVCSHLLTLAHRSRIFLPWRWRRYVAPKRRLTQDLHSATSQKTTFSQVGRSSPIFRRNVLPPSSRWKSK
jgi:hypothetical protein